MEIVQDADRSLSRLVNRENRGTAFPRLKALHNVCFFVQSQVADDRFSGDFSI